MELRSCIHLHFIKTLTGGVLKKTLNVASGKPVLRFKNVKDICEELDAKNGHLFPTIPPKDEFRGLHIDSSRIMTESTDTGNVGNIKIKSEPEDSGFDCNDGGNSDLDCFGNVTLKQIKQTCKTKKRKRSKFTDLNEQLEMCSPVKQEYSMSQANEDNDLLEPLSNLRSKLSKNAKAKTKSKRVKKGASTISQKATITIKSEQIPTEQELLQFNQVTPACERDIEVDVPEPGCSDVQNTSCFDDDTSLVYDNMVSYYGVVPTEFPMTAAELSIFPTDENQSCVVYEPFCEDMEYDPMPLQVVSNSGWDIVKADDTEITNYQCLDFWPALESRIQGYIMNSVHPDLIEAISSDDTISSEDALLCQINSETKDGLFRCTEPIKGSDACTSDAYSKGDLPSNQEASANSVGDCDLGSGSCLVSVADHVSMSNEEEKQSQLFACADAKISLSPGDISCEASDECTAAASGGYLKPQLPQRLFPTRKAISPASQEKLCKAMKSIELQDGHSACKGKLCFGKHTESTNHGAEWQPNQIRRPKFSITPQTIRNPKNEKISSHPRGIPKASNGSSTAPPRFSTGCTSIRTCSDSAIAFSQRQMHDIECITTKLTNELQTMKEIAEERLLSGPYPTTSLKYNADEVRMAIQNVTRVEASAKKLLSMMSRDCSRFCKIMRMADQNDSNDSEDVGNNHPKTTIVNKERKKITFADEAGEKLCHVRVFENEMISSSVTGPSQNQELLVK
ncbi:hypothetical protein RchiOBHm_Chr6g0300761 [Rosa chinensis]|uniref:Uncharacterized protein n=1 Tax=Rosa chinensis TaxID=74649 RepID=A0A2P6PYK6_ROSCH|nr:uncharacterized protein LOC112174037 [Rosa chinensis]PRQ27011.1 hypothetical protein RchiOBHm_Chr6g0300761 [Rosa chinensis]